MLPTTLTVRWHAHACHKTSVLSYPPIYYLDVLLPPPTPPLPPSPARCRSTLPLGQLPDGLAMIGTGHATISCSCIRRLSTRRSLPCCNARLLKCNCAIKHPTRSGGIPEAMEIVAAAAKKGGSAWGLPAGNKAAVAKYYGQAISNSNVAPSCVSKGRKIWSRDVFCSQHLWCRPTPNQNTPNQNTEHQALRKPIINKC